MSTITDTIDYFASITPGVFRDSNGVVRRHTIESRITRVTLEGYVAGLAARRENPYGGDHCGWGWSFGLSDHDWAVILAWECGYDQGAAHRAISHMELECCCANCDDGPTLFTRLQRVEGAGRGVSMLTIEP